MILFFAKLNSISTVAAEQVITEIGEHTSFQGIIDQLQCEDRLVSRHELLG